MDTCSIPELVINLYNAYNRFSQDCDCSMFEVADLTTLCGATEVSLVQEIHDSITFTFTECLGLDITTQIGYPGNVPSCLTGQYLQDFIDFLNNTPCDNNALDICDIAVYDGVQYLQDNHGATSYTVWADCGRYFLPGTYSVSYKYGSLLWKGIWSFGWWFFGGQSFSAALPGNYLRVVSIDNKTGIPVTLFDLPFLNINNNSGYMGLNPDTLENRYLTTPAWKNTFTLTQHSRIGVTIVGNWQTVDLPNTVHDSGLGNVTNFPRAQGLVVSVTPCYCAGKGFSQDYVLESSNGRRYCKNWCSCKGTDSSTSVEAYSCKPTTVVVSAVYPNPTTIYWTPATTFNCWTSSTFTIKENTGGSCDSTIPMYSPDDYWPGGYVAPTICGNDAMYSSGTVLAKTDYPNTTAVISSPYPFLGNFCVRLKLDWYKRDSGSNCTAPELTTPETETNYWYGCIDSQCSAETYFDPWCTWYYPSPPYPGVCSWNFGTLPYTQTLRQMDFTIIIAHKRTKKLWISGPINGFDLLASANPTDVVTFDSVNNVWVVELGTASGDTAVFSSFVVRKSNLPPAPPCFNYDTQHICGVIPFDVCGNARHTVDANQIACYKLTIQARPAINIPCTQGECYQGNTNYSVLTNQGGFYYMRAYMPGGIGSVGSGNGCDRIVYPSGNNTHWLYWPSSDCTVASMEGGMGQVICGNSAQGDYGYQAGPFNTAAQARAYAASHTVPFAVCCCNYSCEEMNCTASCTQQCAFSCTSSCKSICKETCTLGTCTSGSCNNSCTGSCNSSCTGGCTEGSCNTECAASCNTPCMFNWVCVICFSCQNTCAQTGCDSCTVPCDTCMGSYT